MTQTTDYKNRLLLEVESVRKDANRTILKLSISEFSELFILEAKLEMAKRGVYCDFNIDAGNKDIINQLYHYLICDDKFSGSLTKGILIRGSVGVGKTLIMNVICNMITGLTSKNVTRIHSNKLFPFLKENGNDYLDKRPLFIDEIGKEPKENNDYGTKYSPFAEMMYTRYDNGAWTFATTNYNDDTLMKFYGETIIDRFKEMFNVITIKGNSRRK